MDKNIHNFVHLEEVEKNRKVKIMDEKITSNYIQDTNNEEITIPLENSSTKIDREGNFIKVIFSLSQMLTRKKKLKNSNNPKVKSEIFIS